MERREEVRWRWRWRWEWRRSCGEKEEKGRRRRERERERENRGDWELGIVRNWEQRREGKTDTGILCKIQYSKYVHTTETQQVHTTVQYYYGILRHTWYSIKAFVGEGLWWEERLRQSGEREAREICQGERDQRTNELDNASVAFPKFAPVIPKYLYTYPLVSIHSIHSIPSISPQSSIPMIPPTSVPATPILKVVATQVPRFREWRGKKKDEARKGKGTLE